MNEGDMSHFWISDLCMSLIFKNIKQFVIAILF